MIRIQRIQESLMHLVGWQQSYDPQKQISADLTESESGLMYQQAHPMVTLENVRAIMPEVFISQYPTWDKDTEYSEGQIVSYQNKVWQFIGDEPATNQVPAEGSDYWAEYDLFSVYLTDLTKQAIVKTVQTFLQGKSLLKESKTLLERRSLFDGAGRLNNVTPNSGKLVGMEIVPAYSMGVTTKLERIGLQMVGNVGKVKLYVFHSSQVDPQFTIEFNVTKGDGSMEWKDLTDVYLPYMGDTGAWYVVYNQDELPAGMEAVNVTKDWSREPCGTCNRGSLEAWRALTKYMMISPFKVTALETFTEYPELWDIADNIYTNTHNYGMNMVVSVGCDLTDFIVSQKEMFATVLQRQMAVDILRTLALNPQVRVNRQQSNASTADLLYEVDGNPQGRKSGLGADLEAAYKALDLDTRGIDRICLTCRPTGVKYRHV